MNHDPALEASDAEKGIKVVAYEQSITDDTSYKDKSRGCFGNFIDGFKRVPIPDVDTTGMTMAQAAAARTACVPLKRHLTGLQIQLIALAASIGTGLFVGSGVSLRIGGPGGVLIAFSLIGIMLFNVCMALGELSVHMENIGSFTIFTNRFVSPSLAFAVGLTNVGHYCVLLPFELLVGSLVIDYWRVKDDNPATRVSPAVWVLIFWVVLALVNIFGVRGFGYAEACFSIIKVITIIGFIIFGIVATVGGVDGNYRGNQFWSDPGAFASGFKGVASVFVTAAFAFASTELAGVAAAETASPERAVPRAIKQVFWRIILFYIISLTMVSFLVRYDDPRLTIGSRDGRSSPFVIALDNTGVKGLPSVMNSVILISVLSVGNSAIYGGSRILCSLSLQGMVPKFFSYMDRRGQPLVAILTVIIFGPLGFLIVSEYQGEAFDWMLALCGLSTIFTWSCICIAHIRFRMGMHAQGRSLEELSFKAVFGVWGSAVGLLINVVVVVLQFWVAGAPVGGGGNAAHFFKKTLSVFLSIFLYFAHMIYHRQWRWKDLFVRAHEMDLDSGVRVKDPDEHIAINRIEKDRVRARPWFYRWYYFWC